MLYHHTLMVTEEQSNKIKRYNIYLYVEQHAAIRLMAYTQGKTISKLLREFIDKGLPKKKKQTHE
jgi:hypothetical protein